MNKSAVIVLAKGFEEVEAVTPIDMLRRAGIKVIVAGVNEKKVKGAHDIIIETDVVIDEITSLPDALIFPGGMPGAENLASSIKVKDLIRRMNGEKRIIAAICASPAILLAPMGILDGKEATCFPGMEENFSIQVKAQKGSVIQDGNIITSKGPGTAGLFSLKIIENLAGGQTAELVGERALLL